MRIRAALFISAMLLAANAPAADIETLEKSVVRVLAKTSSGVSTGTGAVVAIDMVLTNHHVVKGGNEIVVGSKHTGSLRNAKVLWQSSNLDLAILRVEGLSLPTVKLAAPLPGKGDKVWALGYPGVSDYDGPAEEATVTPGVISNLYRRPWDGSGGVLQILQHTAPVNPGNSGGPLFNECGDVVGINTQAVRAEVGHGTFFASHIAEAVPHIKSQGVTPQIITTACSPSAGQAVAGLDEAIKEALDLARKQAEQTMRISLATGLGLGLLTLAVIALAFRRPRQQAAKAVEQINQASRKYVQSIADAYRAKRAALVLAGFDTAGKKQHIPVPMRGASSAEGGHVIGRHAGLVDYALNDHSLSRRHARITAEQGQCHIEDLNSAGGTRINGRQLQPFTPTPIAPGDLVVFGAVEMQVSGGG